MPGKLTIGPPQSLRFEIEWLQPAPADSAVEATSGRLLAWIGEDLAWGENSLTGDYKPLEWGWVELLEFLSRSWPYIEWESGYPLGLNPLHPTELPQRAEERSQSMPEDRWRQEEGKLFAFEETHNLACALQGYYVPALWIVREQGIITVGAEKRAIRRPAAEVLTTLKQVGDLIHQRVKDLADSRSQKAAKEWETKKPLDRWKLAQIATGIDVRELKRLAGSKGLNAFELQRGEFRVTEALDLVCMTRGHLRADHLSRLLAYLKAVPRTDTPGLDAVTAEAREVIERNAEKKPYDQGYELAQWYRSRPKVVNAQGAVNPGRQLTRLGVSVADKVLGGEKLDAIAFWGPRHGPAVFVNRNEHNKVFGARRATLAHELCHILVDRTDALPLGEVMNGNVPRWYERRANAFAAELLLPRSETEQAVAHATGIETCVRDLSKRFEVSWELAAWQIRNSKIRISPADSAILRRMVRDPWEF